MLNYKFLGGSVVQNYKAFWPVLYLLPFTSKIIHAISNFVAMKV